MTFICTRQHEDIFRRLQTVLSQGVTNLTDKEREVQVLTSDIERLTEIFEQYTMRVAELSELTSEYKYLLKRTQKNIRRCRSRIISTKVSTQYATSNNQTSTV